MSCVGTWLGYVRIRLVSQVTVHAQVHVSFPLNNNLAVIGIFAVSIDAYLATPRH